MRPPLRWQRLGQSSGREPNRRVGAMVAERVRGAESKGIIDEGTKRP